MSGAEQTIVLLVASMSGTAEMVADELAQELKTQGLTAKIIGMEKAKLSLFAEHRTFIVCSSTYGEGDIPDNGQAFYAELTEQRPRRLIRPDCYSLPAQIGACRSSKGP